MTDRLIYEGQVVKLALKRALLPDGKEMTLEHVHHSGGAAVVAIDQEGGVCLVKQYRAAVGDWLWELPAGKRDNDEPWLATAQRELAEEAGREAAQWQTLCKFYSSPGFCDEQIHLFLARDLTAIPTRHEEHEHMEVHWVAIGEALEWARQGRIVDAKTFIGLFLASEQLARA